MCLCCWIVDSYQGMISMVVFFGRDMLPVPAYQGHPSKRRNGSGTCARATKEVGGPMWMFSPVSYAASILYSVQVAHLDPWLPKHPWRCGRQTATESTHVSNQKLQPPRGAALQIQWSKYPFPKVYWITVFSEDSIRSRVYGTNPAFITKPS